LGKSRLGKSCLGKRRGTVAFRRFVAFSEMTIIGPVKSFCKLRFFLYILFAKHVSDPVTDDMILKIFLTTKLAKFLLLKLLIVFA
jgi:hypothetical protein